jgi:hypothetical protein
MSSLINIPILGFAIRYWKLLLLTVAFVLAALNDQVFQTLGALIYVPAVGAVAIITTLLIRHLFYHSTLDLDAASGKFAAEWNALSPERRQTLTCAYFIGLFVGVCLIAASVGK